MPISSPAAGHGISWMPGNPHPHPHRGWNHCLRQCPCPWGSDFPSAAARPQNWHLWGLARLDQGSALTVSCARPQTPTSGNSCTGQVSYPYGPAHHTPGKTEWEVGYKRRKKRIQPTEMSPLLLFIYPNFMQALSKACSRYTDFKPREEVIPDADVIPHLDQMKKVHLNLFSVQKRSWN